MAPERTRFQIIWGAALIFAGIGVFYRIPQVMPAIETIEHFSSITWLIRFCFYFVGILLIGGGIKKICYYVSKSKNSGADTPKQ